MKAIFHKMLLMFMALTFTTTVAIADSMPGKVNSAEQAEAVLEMRSETMKQFGSAMKAFGNFLKRGDGEPLELAGMAAQVAEGASKIPSLFPEATGMADFEDSESKAEIWQNWADFVAAAEAMVEPAMMVETAFDSEDKGAIGAAVKKLGTDGCKNCHTQFREKKE